MLEWVLFLSQLGLWVMVVQLYRSRAQDRQNAQMLVEHKAQQETEGSDALTTMEFDFLDSEAVTRMATIRTLLDEIEDRAQRLSSDQLSGALSASAPPIPPVPTSAEESEVLTAFLAPRADEIEPTSVPDAPRPYLLGYRTQPPIGDRPNPGRRTVIPEIKQPGMPAPKREEKSAAAEVRSLANTGLDAASIARRTGRQLEEVNLLLHMARKPGRDQSGGSDSPTSDDFLRRQA